MGQRLRRKRGSVSIVVCSSKLTPTKTYTNIQLVEFIKKHDNPADIRFLSDQVRTEFSPEGVSFTNWRAGQEITKFIREEGFLAPILILTAGRGLVLTRYVEAYKRVGSLVGYKGYKQYVDALGARRKDDTQWAKYGGP